MILISPEIFAAATSSFVNLWRFSSCRLSFSDSILSTRLARCWRVSSGGTILGNPSGERIGQGANGGTHRRPLGRQAPLEGGGDDANIRQNRDPKLSRFESRLDHRKLARLPDAHDAENLPAEKRTEKEEDDRLNPVDSHLDSSSPFPLASSG